MAMMSSITELGIFPFNSIPTKRLASFDCDKKGKEKGLFRVNWTITQINERLLSQKLWYRVCGEVKY